MEGTVSSSALGAVLRFSLVATSKSSSIDFNKASPIIATDGPPIDENNPRIRKLIEQILFSRRFVLTYYVVVAGVLTIFTTAYWGSKLVHRRKRGKTLVKKDYKYGSGGSSSSSTLEGTASPPQKQQKLDNDESTPLLSNEGIVHYPSFKASWLSKTKSWLMYQPAPIRPLGYTFPSNATSLLIIAFLGLNAFYLLYHVPFTMPMLFAFADRAGLVFVVNLPLLYILSAKNQPLKWLTGSSYEALNIFHRRLGEWMIFLALLHALGMLGVWYTLLQPIGFSLARFLASKIILLGIFAFLTYDLIYFTSTGLFRQQFYELFLGLHVTLQVATLVLVWFHHHNSRPYIGAALAIFVIDRLIFRITLNTKTLRASLNVMDDGETVMLSSTVPLSRGRGISESLRTSVFSGWKATEHVFVAVPSLAGKHFIQAHPFTIASKPPQSNDVEGSLRLLIRAQDGFSKDLVRYAKGHDSVAIRIDGPYGSQSAVELLQESDQAIIFAGGSGIAVAWPLVWSLIKPEDIDAEALEASERRPRRILLVWVVHDRRHFSWIASHDIDRLSSMGVDLVLPPPTSEVGRPDVRSTIKKWVEESENEGSPGTTRTGVVVSGPDSMNRDVRNACASLVAQGRNMEVEVEKFGW